MEGFLPVCVNGQDKTTKESLRKKTNIYIECIFSESSGEFEN